VKRDPGLAKSIVNKAFPFICCGFCGQVGETCPMEIAHLDHDAANNRPENLARLCPTHHRQYDASLLSREAILIQQDHWQKTRGVQCHKGRMKTAGVDARETRARNKAKADYDAMTPGQKSAWTKAQKKAASAAADQWFK
jgi:hypothetical protein